MVTIVVKFWGRKRENELWLSEARADELKDPRSDSAGKWFALKIMHRFLSLKISGRTALEKLSALKIKNRKMEEYC